MVAESRSPWFTPFDTASLPLTEPHHAPIFDTGPHPAPLGGGDVLVDEGPRPEAVDSGPQDALEISEPIPVPVPPVVVPGQYLYVKWWKLLLVTSGVWAVAGAVGLGFFYWWFHAMDKTWPDFSVLVYVIACVVAALLLSMAEQKPRLAMASIAVLTAPFASGAAAAALYGMYVFGWLTP